MSITHTFHPGDRVLAPTCRGTGCACGNLGGPGRIVAGPYPPEMGLHLVALDDDAEAPPRVFRAVDLRREPTV